MLGLISIIPHGRLSFLTRTLRLLIRKKEKSGQSTTWDSLFKNDLQRQINIFYVFKRHIDMYLILFELRGRGRNPFDEE